jgi:hypothetical protein
LDIHVEVPKGGTRKAKDGSWSVTNMPAHYGYFKGTKGADGEQVDVYLGGHSNDDVAWIVDQVDAKTGRFDEHKIMAGFPSRDAAVKAYDKAFGDGNGPARMGSITPIHVSEFKSWVKGRDTKTPFAKQRAAVAKGENVRGFAA